MRKRKFVEINVTGTWGPDYLMGQYLDRKGRMGEWLWDEVWIVFMSNNYYTRYIAHKKQWPRYAQTKAP
jgi:hypothetical protein